MLSIKGINGRIDYFNFDQMTTGHFCKTALT